MAVKSHGKDFDLAALLPAGFGDVYGGFREEVQLSVRLVAGCGNRSAGSLFLHLTLLCRAALCHSDPIIACSPLTSWRRMRGLGKAAQRVERRKPVNLGPAVGHVLKENGNVVIAGGHFGWH
jgi:hypothetical protein